MSIAINLYLLVGVADGAVQWQAQWRGLGSAKVKHDCAVRGNEAPIDNAWIVVRPAGQPADAPEQGMPAHLKMLHSQGWDHNGLAVVHGAGLQNRVIEGTTK